MKLTGRQFAGVGLGMVAVVLIGSALWTAHRRLTNANDLRQMYGYMMLMIQVCFAATVGSTWLMWLAITRATGRIVRLLVIVVLFPATWWGLNMLPTVAPRFGGPHTLGQLFQFVSGYGFGLLVVAAWVFFSKPRKAS